MLFFFFSTGVHNCNLSCCCCCTSEITLMSNFFVATVPALFITNQFRITVSKSLNEMPGFSSMTTHPHCLVPICDSPSNACCIVGMSNSPPPVLYEPTMCAFRFHYLYLIPVWNSSSLIFAWIPLQKRDQWICHESQIATPMDRTKNDFSMFVAHCWRACEKKKVRPCSVNAFC